ncbi:hypothetical protein [Acidovorax sp.]|uniref:hypothetical protein n=1 Tax=Acidovorax sp. TaxID=1872122 RepID=UPI00198E2B2C|nr:hypothetical protein [Acidovorax sp.]MBC8263882.1 hypothetical protein [Anaerolineales bacterium]MBL7091746.1 hypothetical protein [Acidovorax sp.]
MEHKHALRISALMVFLMLVVTGAALFFTSYWGTQSPLAFATAAVAIISFFGFLILAQIPSRKWVLAESHVRTAITASIVIEYLTMVALVTFFQQGAERLPAITQTLVTNFTTIVGVVIAFYFGASAFVQARSQEHVIREPEEDQGEHKPTSSKQDDKTQ